MQTRIKVVFVCILMVFALIATACNNDKGNGSASTPAPSPTETPTPAPAPNDGEPVEVVIFTNSSGDVESFDTHFGDSLRAQFPDYKITYIPSQEGSYLRDLITTGTRFDIIYENTANYLTYMTEFDIGYDMTDLISQHDVDLSQIEPMMIDALSSSTGGIHALPIYNNSLIMYYNKDLFDRFGVDYPVDGMYWDEVLEMAQKLTRKEDDSYFLGLNHVSTHTMRLNPLGIPIADVETNTPTINQDERWGNLINTLFAEPFKSPVYQEYIEHLGKIPSFNEFTTEKNFAMFAYLGSFANLIAAEGDINWDMVALPTFKETPGVGSQASPVYFGITKQAENKDAAMQVIKYLVSKEYQSDAARTGRVPVLIDPEVRKEFAQDLPYKDKNIDAYFYNDYSPTPEKGPYDGRLTNLYAKYADMVTTGELDLNTALRQAEEEGQQLINEMLQTQ